MYTDSESLPSILELSEAVALMVEAVSGTVVSFIFVKYTFYLLVGTFFKDVSGRFVVMWTGKGDGKILLGS